MLCDMVIGVRGADAETQVIPSITISERYDSNVFRAPPGRIQGRELWDFATSANADVQVLNRSRRSETSIRARVNGNTYVNNPELNYVSTNLNVYSVLDGWVSQLVRGARLKLSESFRFTPEPPTFLLAGSAAEPTAQRTDFLVRGIQLARANTFANTAAARGSIPLSRRVSLQGTYQHTVLRVGSTFVDQAGDLAFFNTTLQDWTVGTGFQVTRSDSVIVNYKTTQMNLSGPVGDVAFTARGVAGEYVKDMPGWKMAFHGGATYLDQGSKLYFTGGLTVTADYGPNTSVRAAVSREVAPAFFGRGISTGGALISTVGGISLEHKLSKSLNFVGGANYAYNETVPLALATFTSYRLSGMLTYRIGPKISTSLFYNYISFKQGGTARESYQVDRNVIMLSVSAAF
jgi:hypothetical protein